MQKREQGQWPGFVDAHVHIRRAAGLEAIRAAGITAVRDAGMRQHAGPGHPQYPSAADGPLVIRSGWALYKRGGYGSLFGVSVETREDLHAEILQLKNAGVDIIKVMASGMVSLKTPGAVTSGGFSQDELQFIVEQAGRLGLGVMAHANGEPAILASARAGVRSVEHGFFMTEEALIVMARQGVFWTPTVGALARAAETGVASGDMKAYIADLIAVHIDMIRHAHGLGVPLAVGTDCVLPAAGYKAAYDAELGYFEQAGLPRDEVMKIACEGGARLLELRDSS